MQDPPASGHLGLGPTPQQPSHKPNRPYSNFRSELGQVISQALNHNASLVVVGLAIGPAVFKLLFKESDFYSWKTPCLRSGAIFLNITNITNPIGTYFNAQLSPSTNLSFPFYELSVCIDHRNHRQHGSSCSRPKGPHCLLSQEVFDNFRVFVQQVFILRTAFDFEGLVHPCYFFSGGYFLLVVHKLCWSSTSS